MEKIYKIGRYDQYSDGKFKIAEQFLVDGFNWRVFNGRIYSVFEEKIGKDYIESMKPMNMSEEEAIAKNCGCYYKILE